MAMPSLGIVDVLVAPLAAVSPRPPVPLPSGLRQSADPLLFYTSA